MAKTAAVFYLLVFVFGFVALATNNKPVNLLATASYVVVTALFYLLFKPVNEPLSLTAAFFSLVGCAAGVTGNDNNSLVFFGFYCLLIGYLVYRSAFLPKFAGVLMGIAGAGWLTFLWPPLAKMLTPYNLLPGIIGEGVLTICLLLLPSGARSLQPAGSIRAPDTSST